MRHQRLRDRVIGITREGLSHFAVPPRKLAGSNAWVAHLVYNIVDFTAKGIKRSDGCAALRGKE